MLEGRIFVTGGAGFLARALYARAARERWMCDFTAYSRDDAKHANLLRRFPRVTVIRGDVSHDPEHLRAAMTGHDLVLHMAAAKYVDLSELNAWNTVATNVIGSMNTIRAAIDAQVHTVIAISTDKAAGPVNTYGASKFLMERLIQDFARLDAQPRMLAVRYGNVIGSTGSAIPLFRRQYQDAGEVLVTDPDMTRFWMTADQALDCIGNAYHAGEPGTVTIPTRAKIQAMRLIDVVHAAIGTVQPVKLIGPRPGEKKHESLVTEPESLRIVTPAENGYYQLLRPDQALRGEGSWSFSSDDADLMTAAAMVQALNEAAAI